MTVAAWFPERMLSFDVETTGPEPETARIVTAHAVECSPAGAQVLGAWLVNPGCPIPPDATKVHGITDEIAATGWPTVEALPLIVDVLRWAWALGLPVVIMNARFDVAVVQAELARLELPPLEPGQIIDPHVIDKGIDPFRKGGRKLLDLAKHYGVKLGEAHNAADDALMAARIVWAMARWTKGRFKDIAHLTIDELQQWQTASYAKWALQYRSFLRADGKPSDIDAAWPLRTQRSAA